MNLQNSTDRCTQYAIDVKEGCIVAGKLVRQACERHLNDMKRQGTDNFPYVFKPEKAERVYKFAEKLKYFDGSRVGEYVQLAPFQRFIIGSLFGWEHKDTGYRRFRKSFVMLARKNAKTLLNAIICLYLLLFEGVSNAQFYCCATKTDQAKLLVNQLVAFAKNIPVLNKRIRHYEREGRVKVLKNDNVLRALSRDTKSMDGFLPYVAVCDEIHAYRDSSQISLLQDGQNNLPECLLSIITTAGTDTSPQNACIVELDYAKKVLNDVYENDTYFCYVAQMDEKDDPFDVNNLIKANPLLPYIEGFEKNLVNAIAEAKAKGGKVLADLYSKVFNQFYDYTENNYLSLDEIRRNASDLTIEDMQGKHCYVGIDLAAADDLCGISFIFPSDSENEEDKADYVHSIGFMPEGVREKKERQHGIPYTAWKKEGFLFTTPGIRTNYQYITDYIFEITNKYSLQVDGIGYDQHDISPILEQLCQFDCPVIDILQSSKSLYQATEDVRLSFLEGKLLYNRRNSLLELCLNNAVLCFDSFLNCKIDKKRQKNKIDLADSLINARKIQLVLQNEKKKVNMDEVLQAFNNLYDSD